MWKSNCKWEIDLKIKIYLLTMYEMHFLQKEPKIFRILSIIRFTILLIMLHSNKQQ
jgi:hypothetical protein